MTTTTYRVTGMTCDHCVKAVTDELMTLEAVTGISIDLPAGVVTVESHGPLDQQAVAAAVDEAGYSLV